MIGILVKWKTPFIPIEKVKYRSFKDFNEKDLIQMSTVYPSMPLMFLKTQMISTELMNICLKRLLMNMSL